MQKLHRFTAEVFVQGVLQSQQLKGPSTFKGWEVGWSVFRSAAIMTTVASPSEIDAYSSGIRALVGLFPDAWGIIHQADEVMRAEQCPGSKKTCWWIPFQACQHHGPGVGFSSPQRLERRTCASCNSGS